MQRFIEKLSLLLLYFEDLDVRQWLES